MQKIIFYIIIIRIIKLYAISTINHCVIVHYSGIVRAVQRYTYAEAVINNIIPGVLTWNVR